MRRDPAPQLARHAPRARPHNLYYHAGPARDDVIGLLPLANVGLHMMRFFNERFGGDRARGTLECAREARPAWARERRTWSRGQSMWWHRWAPLVVALPGIARWSAEERRSLAELILAKGGRRESDFVWRFDAHARLRAALRALARARPADRRWRGTPRSPAKRGRLARHGAGRYAMSDMNEVRGHAVVVQPGGEPSYWQPVPANGHADPALHPAVTRFEGLSMGYQTVAPGGRIREHSHGDQVELQICFRGRGHVVVDGVSHPLTPGTACFLGYDVRHEILNESDEELVLLWVVSPARARALLRGDRRATPGGRARALAVRPPRRRGRHRAVSSGSTTPDPRRPGHHGASGLYGRVHASGVHALRRLHRARCRADAAGPPSRGRAGRCPSPHASSSIRRGGSSSTPASTARRSRIPSGGSVSAGPSS